MKHDLNRERSNRAYYLAQGRCPQCGGKRPLMPGHKMCEQCRKKNVESKRKLRDARKASGLCRECGKPIEDERHTACASCREKIRRNEGKMRSANCKSLYYERREAGRCVSCGDWAEPGRARCKKCQEKSNLRSKLSDPGREKFKAMRQKRMEAELCPDCGKPVAPGMRRCKKCLSLRRDSTRKYEIMQRLRRGTNNV